MHAPGACWVNCRRHAAEATRSTVMQAGSVSVCNAPKSHCGLDDRVADEVLARVVELLGCAAAAASFLPVCHRWLCLTVCHPAAFREPLRAWQAAVCTALDHQLRLLQQPPPPSPTAVAAQDSTLSSFDVVLAEMGHERRLTELFSSLTNDLVLHTKRLVSLRNLLARFDGGLTLLAGGNREVPLETGIAMSSSAGAGMCPGCPRAMLAQEFAELRLCVTLLSMAATDLCRRLPDPEVPLRWASQLWYAAEAGQVDNGWEPERLCRHHAGIAAVWNDYRRMFLQTARHIEVLADSLGACNSSAATPQAHDEEQI
eukprot:gnl/TRDRNA2_/TRDRNA2_91250_c0_seq1.p1 gnl/TRDRNA2_/TRDRNA2_91250_c0~~gnl/TRDRNA2_/TRDRNA2_91250_c0_seq1.p1  ORF type:complete len:314 (+),score=61.81 gnl/TRDRNA2_/TRDRNA2_91250_c0_seq1:1-942(+)